MIKTERLEIVPLSAEDMQRIIAHEPDAEMKQTYTEMLESSLKHPPQRLWYVVWLMRQRCAPHAAVGDLCFKGLGADGMVEIGYGMKPEYEGNGYMTEAVAAMCDWAAAQPGVLRVEAETDPGNAASQRVLQKAGFRPTGTLGEEGPRFVRCR